MDVSCIQRSDHMSFAVSGMDSSSISTLFSSLNSSNSSSASVSSSILSDYYSIQNGSYYKLMKQYYANDTTSSSDASKTSDKTSDKTATSSKTNNYIVKSDASALVDSVKSLSDASLYQGTTTNAADGTKSTTNNTDKLYSLAKDFVDNYNDLVDSGANSDSTGVLTNLASMTNYSKANTALLKNIGISINGDNKLSVDEDTFKKASATDIKSVLSSGYTSQISANASMVSYYANAAISTSSIYTSSGSYSQNSAATTFSIYT